MKSTASTVYNKKISAIYSKRQNKDTGFLGYRDIPKLLETHSCGNNALDYGCGSGFSTAILKEKGFNVLGVDINLNMLELARQRCPGVNFIHINEDEILPFEQSFDVVLMAFVLLEISSEDAVVSLLENIKRTMSPKGKLFIITTSEHFPKNNWLTGLIDTDKYKNIKNGHQYKVFDTKNNMEFSDFFYDNNCYLSMFGKSGFKVDTIHQPLGRTTDNIFWTTELSIPPYTIYICSHE